MNTIVNTLAYRSVCFLIHRDCDTNLAIHAVLQLHELVQSEIKFSESDEFLSSSPISRLRDMKFPKDRVHRLMSEIFHLEDFVNLVHTRVNMLKVIA